MTTYDSPSASQVAILLPGSSNLQWLGQVGHVTALNWGFIYPGGADQMACTLQVPATYRNQMFNVGNTVRIYHGAAKVWDGIMDGPVPTTSGWNFTATGTGNLGQNYVDYFTDPWPTGEPDEAVNDAIGRGLPWVNPGIGSPSGIWLGQGTDPASQTISALLNLICTRGALGWYVNSQPGGTIGDNLSVAPLPTAVDRLLISTQPVPRSLGGYTNTIFIKYEVSAAASSSSSTQSAVYAVTSVQNAASVAVHGVLETYIDLSSAGVMSAGAAQAVGNAVLQIYQAASFAGPFTCSQGQITNLAGQPIDLATEQAGHVYRPIFTDYGYGGEVNPAFPQTFIGGAYSWDDMSRVAQVTPYQSLDQSISGLLSMESTVLTPITTAP